MGLPNVIVDFKTKATTAITRSEKGIVCVVLTDATGKTVLNEYKSASDIVASEWTDQSRELLENALAGGANKLYAVRMTVGNLFGDIEEVLDSIKFNWICYVASDQTDLFTYVKKRNNSNTACKIKAVVSGIESADDMHVVCLKNESVTLADGSELTAMNYLPTLAGLFAGLSLDRSATYYELDDLSAASAVTDVDTEIDNGYLVLINDYGTVKIARAVNTAQKVEIEDFKKIVIVEAMDMIREDIIDSFKNYYLGKYKNSLDNQSLFVAAVNTYFRTLAGEGVLNPDYENLAEIDVEAQRAAIVASGKTEALDWDDDTVKKNPFKSNVYLKANVQILDAIEDLTFNIYMN